MVSRFEYYEGLIRRMGEDDQTLADRFVAIFRDTDSRLVLAENQAAGAAAIEEYLRSYGAQRIDAALTPIIAAIRAAADLGALLTTSSVTPVSVGLGPATFVVAETDRQIFAPAHMLVATANDDPSCVMWGRRVAYNAGTGELVIDVLSRSGAGTFSSWSISVGVSVQTAGEVAAAPNDDFAAGTVQGLLDELMGAVGGDPDFAETVAANFTAAATAAANAANAAKASAISEVRGAVTAGYDTLGEVEAAILAILTALGKRLRVDAGQTLSPAEKGRALANLGGSTLAGRRSAIINGNFDIWQRGTNFPASATRRFTADRWESLMVTSTVVTTREEFAQGQTDVPGSPRYFIRNVVVAGPGAGDYATMTTQAEGVRRAAGKTSTLTFYARANANRPIAVEFYQRMGTGGSPSPAMQGIGVRKVNLTTVWQKFSITVDMPSIAGKTIGTDLNDFMGVLFWFDAGANINDRTAALGHFSGTVDIAHVSWVLGDATAEDDPYPSEIAAQILADCMRYFQVLGVDITCVAASATKVRYACKFPPMRVTPTTVLTTTTPNIVLGDGTVVGTASALAFGAASNDSLRGSISGFTGLNVGAVGAPLFAGLITLDAEP